MSGKGNANPRPAGEKREHSGREEHSMRPVPATEGRLLSVGPFSWDLLLGYKTESCVTARSGVEYPWEKGEQLI